MWTMDLLISTEMIVRSMQKTHNGVKDMMMMTSFRIRCAAHVEEVLTQATPLVMHLLEMFCNPLTSVPSVLFPLSHSRRKVYIMC